MKEFKAACTKYILKNSASSAVALILSGLIPGSVSLVLTLGFLLGNKDIFAGFMALLVTAVFGLIAYRGFAIFFRNTRIAAYLTAMNGSCKISLQELKSAVGYDMGFIVDDLNKAISRKLIPTGRITADGRYFKIGPPEGEELIGPESETSESPGGIGFIDDGRSYVKQLEKLNASLVSNRFFASGLEKAKAASENLFNYVEAYPGKMPSVKIDVNRNLRKAIGFINEYRELARFSIDNKRISELKSGASSALDDAAKDFKSLYAALKIPIEAGEEHISGKTASEVISAGRAYIRRIRKANDALPGEDVSEKLDRMETVMERVFGYVGQHPEKTPEIKKLMSRHLPMTLKLIDSYAEFEALGFKDDNISSVKGEINNALDTVNKAFETLLSNLARGIVLDVSTDIDVLRTVLAQDGLINNDDFKPKGK